MTDFYSPINRLAEQLPRPKGTGAEFMADLSKRPGYKPQEAEDRGLHALSQLPKMMREEFLAALKAKRPPKLESDENGDETKYSDYQLPGGKNYTETLITLPSNAHYDYESSHWDEPNVLAHLRTSDREVPGNKGFTLVNKKSFNKSQHFDTAEEAQAALQNMPEYLRPSLDIRPSVGPKRKLLHIEEVQSDWHQQGREHGYKGKDFASELGKLENTYLNLKNQLDVAKDAGDGDKIMDLMPKVMAADDAVRKADYLRNHGVPDAPFKKDWHELALKHAILDAARRGYHGIVITPGQEQADRYKLSKQVGTVAYHPEEQHFQAFAPNRETIINEKGATPERVSELIGKDVAKRLMSAPQTMGHHTLEGEDLNVGGEGMKGFYDKIIPNFLDKFGKKYGVKTELHGQPVKIREDLNFPPMGNLPQHVPGEQKYLHHFPITEEMRADIKANGLPMYAKGGSVMGINVASDRKSDRRYADMIVDGQKTLESRNSDTLRPYVGKRVAIVRTGEGKAKAIGEVTVGEPMVVNKQKFRALEDKHHVPEGSAFDINTPTKHLYPMHDPIRYDEERDVGHGIVSRRVIERAKGGAVEVEEPKKTVKAYKLFRVQEKHPGKLFPLFVDSNTPVEMNKWIDAKEGEMANGKVKSKIGPLAYRPGWHAGDLPVATHIGEKSDSSLTAPDVRPANHAWAEVEMPNDVDWQTEANKRGVNKQGRLIASRAHITDQLPKGGHYRYKTNSNMTGNWLIGGSMKVNKMLTDKEVKAINKAAGAADLPREQPFKAKKFGFAAGGTVGPEEFKAEEYVNHLPAAKREANLAKFLKPSRIKDRLYHGTADTQIREFKGNRGVAAHFGFEPQVANQWADARHQDVEDLRHQGEIGPDEEAGGMVYPAHVQVKKIFDIRKPAHHKLIPKLHQEIKNGRDIGFTELEAAVDDMKNHGFDSYYDFENGHKSDPKPSGLAVFRPHQIKSATGNRGTYDTTKADINKAEGGPVPPLRPNFDALRAPALAQAALLDQYKQATAGMYTHQMPTFAQWLATQGKAKGGAVRRFDIGGSVDPMGNYSDAGNNEVLDTLATPQRTDFTSVMDRYPAYGSAAWQRKMEQEQAIKPDTTLEELAFSLPRAGLAAAKGLATRAAPASKYHPTVQKAIDEGRMPESMGEFMTGYVRAKGNPEIGTGGYGSDGASEKMANYLKNMRSGEQAVPKGYSLTGASKGYKAPPRKAEPVNYSVEELRNLPIDESLFKKGGSIKPIGYTKEKVTVAPDLNAMKYEMMSVKHFTKKAK